MGAPVDGDVLHPFLGVVHIDAEVGIDGVFVMILEECVGEPAARRDPARHELGYRRRARFAEVAAPHERVHAERGIVGKVALYGIGGVHKHYDAADLARLFLLFKSFEHAELVGRKREVVSRSHVVGDAPSVLDHVVAVVRAHIVALAASAGKHEYSRVGLRVLDGGGDLRPWRVAYGEVRAPRSALFAEILGFVAVVEFPQLGIDDHSFRLESVLKGRRVDTVAARRIGRARRARACNNRLYRRRAVKRDLRALGERQRVIVVFEQRRALGHDFFYNVEPGLTHRRNARMLRLEVFGVDLLVGLYRFLTRRPNVERAVDGGGVLEHDRVRRRDYREYESQDRSADLDRKVYLLAVLSQSVKELHYSPSAVSSPTVAFTVSADSLIPSSVFCFFSCGRNSATSETIIARN